MRPLLIDPASSATSWLIAHLNSMGPVEVVVAREEKLLFVTEMAVQFGKSLVIQEVDTIHPMLYPLLRGDLIQSGKSQKIMIDVEIIVKSVPK